MEGRRRSELWALAIIQTQSEDKVRKRPRQYACRGFQPGLACGIVGDDSSYVNTCLLSTLLRDFGEPLPITAALWQWSKRMAGESGAAKVAL